MSKKCFLPVIIGIVICILMTGCLKDKEKDTQKPVSYDSLMQDFKENATESELTCWYTEEADKEWLTDMSGLFNKEYGIKVNPVYYDGVSLFEDMNSANQKGNGPDVYICGNDQLEFARNSGLLSVNEYYDDAFWKDNYPEVSKKAVTFKDVQYGYPVYFDTYCLVYDAGLLDSAPASMDDILAFADEYSDTGSTKAILRWDVADPYINTMFLAAYGDIFGENGDDASAFQIYNEKTVETMTYFNSLSEYMWMDKNNISHDIVKDRIEEETLVLGICKSDILPVLQSQDSYEISYIPSLTDTLSSKPYSTTYIAMVNPYTADESAANMFACYLSMGHPEKQYEGNGKLPVVNQKDNFDKFQSVLYAQYLNSCPVPKVMVFGDYLSESSIMFDNIWDGKDVEEQLSTLQKTMEEKIN